MGLREGAIFKVEKVKKKYIDNIRPPRGLLRGFDQVRFRGKFHSFSLHLTAKKGGEEEEGELGCGNVVNPKGFPSFPCLSEGGGGEVPFF